jgi:hypothetical protein
VPDPQPPGCTSWCQQPTRLPLPYGLRTADGSDHDGAQRTFVLVQDIPWYTVAPYDGTAARTHAYATTPLAYGADILCLLRCRTCPQASSGALYSPPPPRLLWWYERGDAGTALL